VRTWYEIEDADGYLAARELLLRRCEAWAVANGLAMSPLLAAALLDSRHFSSDGRLGYWTPAQVRRALLEWIPEKVAASREDLLEAPGSLRTLLRYLDAHGLRDPRGATAGENESAIDAAEKEFADALTTWCTITIDDLGPTGPCWSRSRRLTTGLRELGHDAYCAPPR